MAIATATALTAAVTVATIQQTFLRLAPPRSPRLRRSHPGLCPLALSTSLAQGLSLTSRRLSRRRSPLRPGTSPSSPSVLPMKVLVPLQDDLLNSRSET